ncbi:MAG TPA: hypothetical protein VFM14_16620 [Gemmatimonadales bacterium]|nr:hypothetical protein [Gemmatimonadales bacterium]
MCSRYLGAISLSALALLAGCSDQEPRTPAEPQPAFSHIGLPSCDPGFNSLVSQYFVQPRQGVVQTLRQEMAAAFDIDDKTTVQAKGFAILSNIEAAVNNAESSNATQGSELANRVLECMFTATELTGVTLPVDFVQELTVAGLGGFGIRGGSGFDSEGGVIAHDGFSAVAPPKDSTWSSRLSERVLIYGGRPSSTAISYVWNKIRPAVAFTKPVVVALCEGTSTSLLQENGTFVPFVDPDYIPGFCPGQSATLDARRRTLDRGVFSFAARVFDLLRPSPAHAAVMFSHGSTAGRAGFSFFDLGEVPSVTLQFLQEPVNPVTNVICCSAGTVTVKAVRTSDLTALPGVTVTLITRPATNKGKNTGVAGNVETTNSSGVATFTTLKFLKSGLYTAEATGKIDDPTSQGVDRTPEFVRDISAPFTVGGR